ncbi:MAG: ABC transporter permease [Lachnospiraceae bacterium]|nr:ABC transporter permease [Lachnospiraceae bacterium]
MSPHLSLPALFLAIAISLLTILISAYIPVKRALKKSAIDAIRQTNDIAIRPGKVKTSHFTEKVFGFEGMIATKNYKRNRRKYRATVISLFLSIVLFISTSSWCSYLTKSMGEVLDDHGYDIFYLKHSDVNYSTDTLRSELAQTEGITASTYFSNLYLSGSVNTAATSSQYLGYQKTLAQQLDEVYQKYDKATMDVRLIFLEDHSFRRYLKEQNLPESVFFNHEKPAAVLVNSLQSYNGNNGKYYAYPLLSDTEAADMKLYVTRQMNFDYGGYVGTDEETGELCYNYWDSSDKELKMPLEEACQEIPISIGAAQTEAPDFFSNSSSYTQLFYPYSLMDDVFSDLDPETEYQEIYQLPYSKIASDQLLFQCENHTKVTADLTKLLMEKGLPSENLHDYAASIESDRAMITVVNVFAFGFITLISLIAAANVFNTISTNVNLRRREFAMLKSIGMTPKGFQKMMNFECLLYGFKGLLYGIPVSFLITWLIYRSISAGLEAGFFIPWHSIAIAVGSVFLVVFATMVYSMKKIQKENTIDVLKNENL